LERLDVSLGERSYPIVIGNGILDEIGDACRSRHLGGHAAVVTNSTVGPLYLERVLTSLSAAGFSVHPVEIQDGEEYKTLATLEGIYGELIRARLDRNSFVVALGGGVVGDVAGFAAATYLRGIPVVQVPTTLLSQVDSSVGGKTGVNHSLGKNLIGAFHQPSLVLIDVATLETLSERDFRSGLAEVVKYGAVLDASFFNFLEDSSKAILRRDAEVLTRVVKISCEAKASVVEKDETEGGIRAVLNYGHTLGHAAETLTGYREMTHGEAVAAGMAEAARISERNGFSSAADTARIVRLLQSLGLPSRLPHFSAGEYAEALLRDKKMRDGGLKFVCNRGIGAFEFLAVPDVCSLVSDLTTGD
jgi:3-dehydroquinate synthase